MSQVTTLRPQCSREPSQLRVDRCLHLSIHHAHGAFLHHLVDIVHQLAAVGVQGHHERLPVVRGAVGVVDVGDDGHGAVLGLNHELRALPSAQRSLQVVLK